MKKQLNLELKDSGPCHSSITKCLGDVYVSLLPKSQFPSTVRRECWTEACVRCLLNVKVHILKQNLKIQMTTAYVKVLTKRSYALISMVLLGNKLYFLELLSGYCLWRQKS